MYTNLSGRQRGLYTIAYQQNDLQLLVAASGEWGLCLVLCPPPLWTSPDVLLLRDIICWLAIAFLHVMSLSGKIPSQCPAYLLYPCVKWPCDVGLKGNRILQSILSGGGRPSSQASCPLALPSIPSQQPSLKSLSTVSDFNCLTCPWALTWTYVLILGHGCPPPPSLPQVISKTSLGRESGKIVRARGAGSLLWDCVS